MRAVWIVGAMVGLAASWLLWRPESIAAEPALVQGFASGALVGTAGSLAGFWLLPSLGLAATVWIAASVNGLVFLAAAALARSAPLRTPTPPPAGSHSFELGGARLATLLLDSFSVPPRTRIESMRGPEFRRPDGPPLHLLHQVFLI